MSVDRGTLLKFAGVAVTTGIAGCVEDGDDGDRVTATAIWDSIEN